MCTEHEGCTVIFRPFITRNGQRVYRPDGRMWPIHLRNGES